MARTVLITGCSTGIGRATALRLSTDPSWYVVATARRLADIEGLPCEQRVLDVTDEASMHAALDGLDVSVLVNNAGYSLSGALETLPMDEVRRQFETNVFGLLRLTQLVLPGMRAARRGTIVNLSSMGGRLVFPGGGAYHATKYAVEALSDALRMELRPFGIDVIVVEPGLIRTEFGNTAAGGVEASGPYAEFNETVARSTREVYEGPLSRLGGEPEAVADAIASALTKKRPPTRVPVTPSARLAMGARRLLPDRAWDRAVSAGMR
jgi:NAD(P)-dependent dehydrogenase (short-subunit alcohol dehydrogenase family)